MNPRNTGLRVVRHAGYKITAAMTTGSQKYRIKAYGRGIKSERGAISLITRNCHRKQKRNAQNTARQVDLCLGGDAPGAPFGCSSCGDVFINHVMFKPPNDDYTTGRPYIEAGKFGAQTLSCQNLTSVGRTRSTPQNNHPSNLHMEGGREGWSDGMMEKWSDGLLGASRLAPRVGGDFPLPACG